MIMIPTALDDPIMPAGLVQRGVGGSVDCGLRLSIFILNRNALKSLHTHLFFLAPSLPSMPVLSNIPSVHGAVGPRSCGGSHGHFGIYPSNLHAVMAQQSSALPCLECIQNHGASLVCSQTNLLPPPSGGLPKLYCSRHAHQAHTMS